MPRSDAGTPESATQLRGDATLVAFYISDEHAQEIENQTGCTSTTLATGQTDGARTEPNAAQQVVITNLVQPYVNRLAAERALSFGQLTPQQAPFCSTNFEDGRGYLDVINALGGAAYLACDADPNVPLLAMVDAVAGRASGLFLSARPVVPTLKVALVRAGATSAVLVPRSRDDGFDYDAASGGLFFKGTAFRPFPGDLVVVSYRRLQ